MWGNATTATVHGKSIAMYNLIVSLVPRPSPLVSLVGSAWAQDYNTIRPIWATTQTIRTGVSEVTARVMKESGYLTDTNLYLYLCPASIAL